MNRNDELWNKKISESDKVLMLKHWDINKIDPFLNEDIIYLQSLEGILSSDDLKNRHTYWVRKFYPSGVGVELGFANDASFWKQYNDPINDLYEELKRSTPFNFSFYWNESTLLEVLNH